MMGSFHGSGMRGRAVACLLVICFLGVSVPAAAWIPGADPDDIRTARDFIDKWVINGNVIGNAVGAVVGSSIAAALLPTATGIIVFSMIGSITGGLIGQFIDDRTGIAVNYTSFKRPPKTMGGMWLQDVGPYEQGLYQFNLWVINGGNYAAMATHLALTFAAAAIPGAGFLARPALLIAANYVAGCLGDIVDGMIDLGLVGRVIDVHKGLGPYADEEIDSPSGDPPSPPSSSGVLSDIPVREAYENLVHQIKHGSREQAADALEGFRATRRVFQDAVSHATSRPSASSAE